jgi:hypothetical protein
MLFQGYTPALLLYEVLWTCYLSIKISDSILSWYGYI